MAHLQGAEETSNSIRPIHFIAVGNQPQVPAPFICISTCGLLTIERVAEVVSSDPPRARYTSLTPEQLRGRGTAPALMLLKLFLNRYARFAPKDWLLEQFCRDGELFSSARIENIVSILRGLLCPPDAQELRAHLVAYVRGSTSSSDGYQLAPYPLIWVDSEALAWNVEQAARMERFGDDGLPFWERAYDLAKRGPYLPDEVYADWSQRQRAESEGMLRQSVQALARLYQAQQGRAGEEEALRLLRTHWLAYPHEEDVLRPLMELLGRRECYHEAIQYYERLQKILAQDGQEPTAQTQDVAEYLRTKHIQRNLPLPFSSISYHQQNLASSPLGVHLGYIPVGRCADFYASVNKGGENAMIEAIEQGIIEAFWVIESQRRETISKREPGKSIMPFDSARRATLQRLAVLLAGIAGGNQALVRGDKQGKLPFDTQAAPLPDLDLLSQYIDALSVLLTKGEAHYTMQVSQHLYHQFFQAASFTEDARVADVHLKLGFVVAAAQEYTLAWYQRGHAVIQTYDHMEQAILRNVEDHPRFRHAYARLLAKRGRQHRVLWQFDLCEKECEDGLALTNTWDDYALRTHFLCERAHIEATRGNELLWMRKLEEARTEVLNMPPEERKHALNQIEYMQGEGFKRFALHTQKAFSLSQRERYANAALESLSQWDGSTIEVPGFETVVAHISRAQCFILLDPAQAILLAQQQKAIAEQHYPTLLAKIYRVMFLAQQHLHMKDGEFVQVFQDVSHTAYQGGANIL